MLPKKKRELFQLVNMLYMKTIRYNIKNMLYFKHIQSKPERTILQSTNFFLKGKYYIQKYNYKRNKTTVMMDASGE